MVIIQPQANKEWNAVLAHDDFTCQACGATGDDVGGNQFMRVGYIARNDRQVKNTDADLKTLCPDCDDGFATATLLPRRNAQELLVELRRATVENQLAVLDWLLKKYPKRGTN